jgi:hypothetical protein
MSSETRSRLERKNILVAAETRTHYLLVRDECIALVERTAGGCGSTGSTGILTPNGLAFLVWREGRALLAAKGSEVEAGDALVADIRRFSQDVKSALEG